MTFYARLGGAWERGHTLDVWDAAAGVWRDVREVWAYGAGAWRAIYRRAFLNSPSVEVIPGDPNPNYVITVPIGGIASGPVTCVIRLNGDTVFSNTRTVPSSQDYGTVGTTGTDTLDVRLFNPLGRLLDTQVLL